MFIQSRRLRAIHNVLIAALATLATAHHYPHVVPDATAYCQSGTTASGAQTAPGIVANNQYKLGTKIETSKPVFGRRRFVIKDRIGDHSQLDIFTPSCKQAIAWGRGKVAFRILK